MRFKRVNYKKLKLGPDSQISKSYIRLVEQGTRLAHMAQKSSETEESEKTPKSVEQPEKDFLTTALENCQKFNEDFKGPFDKA